MARSSGNSESLLIPLDLHWTSRTAPHITCLRKLVQKLCEKNERGLNSAALIRLNEWACTPLLACGRQTENERAEQIVHTKRMHGGERKKRNKNARMSFCSTARMGHAGCWMRYILILLQNFYRWCIKVEPKGCGAWLQCHFLPSIT